MHGGECFFSNGSDLDSGRNVLLVLGDHWEWEDAMKTLALKVRRFLASEDGPTAVEYAVMLALIVIVCLTAIQTIGTNANTTFTGVAGQLGS